MSGYTVARVNCSLPCMAEPHGGTCPTEGHWVVGAKWVCDRHFREFCAAVGDDYDDVVAELRADGCVIPYPAEALS